jgi:dTDP-4-amino-4,6-dideoxygalactose transaminase
MQIAFNKPYLTGKETYYLTQVLSSGKLAGDGVFTKKCQRFFEQQFGFKKALLCTSCTDALEMAALLLNIQPGDEVIVPSYTFVSTVNPFVLRGAKMVFVDSSADNPNMDTALIESLITTRTKVILPVHYAGIACDMDLIMALAKKHNLFVVEDAAHSIDSFHSGKRLGSFGHLAAFSFHETKNIQCGEGGMLVINDEQFIARAEVLRDKGTNRSAFSRGEISRYEWVDIGSSFLPSELTAAFLLAQLESLEAIQKKRKAIWNAYVAGLSSLSGKGILSLPVLPAKATVNGHLFYTICKSIDHRNSLIDFLKQRGVAAVFHYCSLHASPFYLHQQQGRALPQSDMYTNCLLRLPFYGDLELSEVQEICDLVCQWAAQEH